VNLQGVVRSRDIWQHVVKDEVVEKYLVRTNKRNGLVEGRAVW
jgi:hypothetical protein